MLHIMSSSILEGTGVEVEREGLEAWMRTMRFSHVNDHTKRGSNSLPPLMYAVQAGRADLTAQLLDAGADIHARIRHPSPRMTLEWNILKNSIPLGGTYA